jgi:uncharacterized protein YlxW (UPF0749 family)
MDSTTMVVIIVLISVGFSVISSMHKRHLALKEKTLGQRQQSDDRKTLQAQVIKLETRIQALEKIVTDEGYAIQKEINNL